MPTLNATENEFQLWVQLKIQLCLNCYTKIYPWNSWEKAKTCKRYL